MSDTNDKLKDFSDSELLSELINRKEIKDTPRSIVYGYPHKTVTIFIGDDAHADITIPTDDLEELNKITS